MVAESEPACAWSTPIIVISDIQGYLLRGSGDGSYHGTGVDGGDRFGGGASAHAPRIEAHAQHGQHEHRNRNVEWRGIMVEFSYWEIE
jgi:hypothetical protein